MKTTKSAARAKRTSPPPCSTDARDAQRYRFLRAADWRNQKLERRVAALVFSITLYRS